MWPQNYDPLHGPLSTVAAAAPIVVLLGLLAIRRIPAYAAALAGLGFALLVAIAVIGMPAPMAARAALLGAAYGLLPIGWIVLNVMFLYQLTVKRGVFVALQRMITGVSSDRRLQLLLIAFCFGSFFEGAAGFGTPVAVTGAMLIGLGFAPFEASVFSLIANTAPVAYGALGTPIVAMQGVSGLDLHALSAMVGRQLPFFSLIVPFWLMAAYAGFGGMLELWPALAVAGITFAIPQYVVSNYHGPWLVDILAAACSTVCLTLFLKVWRRGQSLSPALAVAEPAAEPVAASAASSVVSSVEPADPIDATTNANRASSDSGVAQRVAQEPLAYTATAAGPASEDDARDARDRHELHGFRIAILPWVILTAIVFAWGTPQVKAFLDGISKPVYNVPGLHNLVLRGPPVLAAPTPEAAAFTFNWLSASGTAILLAGIVSGLTLGYSIRALAETYARTLRVVWRSLLTIAAMLALGYTTRYSGGDAILGLAFARTGVLYPFFAAMLGWLGVALTGSDTSSNVLFGSLQRITAEKLGMSPVLMAAANSSGGVMGKMIDAQSIVVASTATRYEGHEWKILRYVFWHSIGLAVLVGILVLLQQYVFTGMIVR